MTENPPTPEAGKDGNNISRLKSAQETFELLTKIFIVAAAVLYVTGFLVVSLHLARYGIHSFSMLRAQYILAGAWFFAHILFFVPIVIVLKYLIPHLIAKYKSPSSTKKDEEKGDREGLASWMDILAWGAIFYLFLFSYGISFFKFDEMSTFANYGVWTLIILSLGYHLKSIYSETRNKKIMFFLLLLMYSVFFFMYITIFSKVVYSKISAEYGGGRPVQVQFHWKDECKIREIAATFQKECKLKKEPVYFDQILATDTDHVIISPCPKIYPRTFEISNDLIDYVEIKYEQKEDIKL